MRKDTPASESEGYSGAQYNAVTETASLESVQLLRLDVEVKPEHTLKGELKLKVDRTVKSCKFDEEALAAVAIFRFIATAKKGRSPAFRCEAEYAVLYAWPEAPNVAAAAAYCKLVGLVTAYPYFRAVTAQMAWNATVTLPPLPPISKKPPVPKTRAELEKALAAAAAKAEKA